jgi:hypothetical protein
MSSMLKTATLSRDYFVPSETFYSNFFSGVSEWLVVIIYYYYFRALCVFVRSLRSKLRVSTRPVDHNWNDDG